MNLKKRLCSLSVLLLVKSIHLLIAQPAIDTIKYSLKQKPTLFAKAGTRISFINNDNAQILGIKAGLNFNSRLRLGLGYSQLYSKTNYFSKKIYFNNTLNQSDSVNAKLHLWYLSLLGEYIYHQNQHWKFSIPLQLGAGESYFQYSTNNQTTKIENNVFFVYEPAVSIEYKIIKWVGVGADIGFRFILTDYKKLNKKLNSPTYAFKILIYYDAIYRHLKRQE